MTFEKIKDFVTDILFPPRCAICDEVLPIGKKHICSKCEDEVVYIDEPYCLKCGKALSKTQDICSDCKKRTHYFKKGVAVFDYGSIADSLYRFKNKGRAEYAKYYAKIIYERKKSFLHSIKPDFLIPVPIHEKKKRLRGYNQSEIISNELSKLSNIPTNTSLIFRDKSTNPLKELSLRERQNNLNKAFKIGVNDVKLKAIVIIDDIYTTGSTIDEMSRTILECCDCQIYFITLTIGRGV